MGHSHRQYIVWWRRRSNLEDADLGQAICVVLSGAATDSTSGLEAIKAGLGRDFLINVSSGF